MKSATRTRHLRSSDAPVCMFHTDYIIWEYLFSIWIGSFKGRHFNLYWYIFHVCKASIHRNSKFRVQVHRGRDGRKHILLLYFKKHNVSLLFWVHTNKSRVFTDWKDVLLLSVWPKMPEYFKSKSAHWRLHLSCSEHTTVQLPDCVTLPFPMEYFFLWLSN